MSSAAKLRKKAAEFEALKQFDRAIAGYARSIEASESEGEEVDVAILNKVGDLTLRQGRIPDAVTYYERAVEHYANSGLFNNAIALCNKILRNAPGRANVYFTLGRICAKKGLRGDATRNFLEYATRVQQEGRLDEGMRALAEITHLMPELEEVRRLVEEHAERAGINLPRRTPTASVAQPDDLARAGLSERSADLVFLEIDYDPARGGFAGPEGPTSSTSSTLAAGAIPSSVGTTGAPHSASASVPNAPGGVPAEPTRAAQSTSSNAVPQSPDGSSDSLGAILPGEALQLVDTFASDSGLVSTAGAGEASGVPPLEGLEASGGEADRETPSRLDGGSASVAQNLTPDAALVPVPDAGDETSPPLEWLMAPDALPPAGAPDGALCRSGSVGAVGSWGVRPLRAAFRLSPHDFILEGELPPLIIDDALVEAGVQRAREKAARTIAEPADDIPLAGLDPAGTSNATTGAEPRREADDLGALADEIDVGIGEGVIASSRETDTGTADARVEHGPAAGFGSLPLKRDEALADAVVDDVVESLPQWRAVSTTPSEPIAAVAAVANEVAASRRDTLRVAVAKSPRNWGLRRRMAEALFEAGERDAALSELETALGGFVENGNLDAAAEIADELVRVAGERVPYHQRRVELAVRRQDDSRLRIAYLDLADALLQVGDETRSRAVYARVLEIDPLDDRARSALGAAAPPVVSAPRVGDDDARVDLAQWLSEESGESSTRMRMREPVVSGDEQADFDALLRHFKDGVARSLGDEDYESHYDLGVAYKEMGLLDDAIAEFQKALRSRKHRLPAYEALGQCFVEQERYGVAATVLSRALHEPGLNDDQRVGVLYLLALSSERIERWSDARDYYQRVYATDIHFRDAGIRLAALEGVGR